MAKQAAVLVSGSCCRYCCNNNTPEAKILPSGLHATLSTSAWCPRQQLVCMQMFAKACQPFGVCDLAACPTATPLSADLLPIIRNPRPAPDTHCFIFGCRSNQVRAPYRVKGQAKHSRGMSIGLLPVHAQHVCGASHALNVTSNMSCSEPPTGRYAVLAFK